MQQKKSDKVYPLEYYASAILNNFQLLHLTRTYTFRFSINLII